MAKKKIIFKTVNQLKKDNIDDAIDNWVNQTDILSKLPDKEEKIFRLTIEIPTYLHKRIKKHCANEEIFIKEKIKNILIENFPEN